jgi:hypothetical protein
MNIYIFEKLFEEEFITGTALENIRDKEKKKLFSLHWELKTLLYLGIVLLTTGLGILIYKNLDTIGHQVIVLSIAVGCAACFGYCFKKSSGFTRLKNPVIKIWPDYILLLGCLLLLIFIAYIQFQYNIFGNRLGMATFIPMIILFVSAYYFDHIGVLSMAITNLAAWAGITVTPLHILQDNDFNSTNIIYTGLALGVVLLAVAQLSVSKNFKAHFAFTYKNFGANVLLISCLAALFSINYLWFLLLGGACSYLFISAIREKSFYFIVITLLYAYVGISYMVIRMLSTIGDIGSVYLGLFYFILSGIFLIRVMMSYNKQFKKI